MNKPAAQNISSRKLTQLEDFSELKIGHISDGKEILSPEPANSKNLIWMGEPEYEEVYQNWSNHLDSIGIDDNIRHTFKIGNILEKLPIQLLDSLKSIPRVDYGKFDCKPDYVASMIKSNEATLWTRFLKYFDFKEEQLALVKLICEELKPSIENYLGTGFRIINIKAFETLPGAHHFGPNKVHRDSLYPTHTYKVFLYMTPPNLIDGTTMIFPAKKEDITRLEGPAGTYLLFNPVTIQHNGIPPQIKRRAMLEIILVPSHKTEINPTFNGTNSTCPISP